MTDEYVYGVRIRDENRQSPNIYLEKVPVNRLPAVLQDIKEAFGTRTANVVSADARHVTPQLLFDALRRQGDGTWITRDNLMAVLIPDYHAIKDTNAEEARILYQRVGNLLAKLRKAGQVKHGEPTSRGFAGSIFRLLMECHELQERPCLENGQKREYKLRET